MKKVKRDLIFEGFTQGSVSHMLTGFLVAIQPSI